MRVYALVAMVLAVAAGFTPQTDAVAQLFVSTQGDDSTSCSSSAPCASLQRARDVIRDMKASTGLPAGGVVVNVAAGDYHAANASVPVLTLSASDSGSSTSPIVYTGALSGGSRLLGGSVVPASAFKPYNGTAPNQVGLPLVQADLDAPGFGGQYGELKSGGLGACTNYKMNVYFNGKPLVLARYPNIAADGQWQWMNIEHVVSEMSSFQFSGTRPASWQSAPDAWLHGYWAFGWADNHVKIASIDTANSTITVDPATPPVYRFQPTARYYGENILTELDAPGEYYIDRQAGMLYLYPPSDIATGEVVVSQLSEIISATGTSYVTIERFGVNFAQGSGIATSGVANMSFLHLDVSGQGRDGVSLEGSDSVVQNCTIMYLGCKGVSTNGGDYTTLAPGNLVVHNNTIATFALWKRTYNPGVAFNGVGNVYTNNVMFDSPHTGMQGSGNNHLFANNVLSDMCYEVTDAGAWYSGRSWSHRGSKLINNTFIRIRNTEKTFLGSPAVQAIYFDDQLSAHFAIGNTIIDSHQGILLGGGRRHQIHNNRFINVPNAIAFDDRGLTWQKAYCSVGGVFEKELEAVHYQSPPYSVEYPNLPNIMNEYPCTPVYNNISSNVYCNGTFIDQSAATIADWKSYAYNNVEACPQQ